eukprot:1194827-Amphidinium_carterae.1
MGIGLDRFVLCRYSFAGTHTCSSANARARSGSASGWKCLNRRLRQTQQQSSLSSVWGWLCDRHWRTCLAATAWLELPAEMLPKAALEVGPHKRVVEYSDCARCLVCFRQTGKVK